MHARERGGIDEALGATSVFVLAQTSSVPPTLWSSVKAQPSPLAFEAGAP